MHWKEVFKRDYSSKIRESEKEFDKWKSTDKTIYLQQSCNKLFSAIENFLMYKYGQRQESYQAIRRMISNNRQDHSLLIDANQLHKFYYNAELQMDRYDAENIYKRVMRRLKDRIRNE